MLPPRILALNIIALSSHIKDTKGHFEHARRNNAMYSELGLEVVQRVVNAILIAKTSTMQL